jgi:hypothetical protein
MGLNAEWIAVHGVDKAAVLQRLGFEETAKPTDYLEARYSVRQLPTGWIVAFFNRGDWIEPGRMAELSAGGRAVACKMAETVNFSAASGWRDGAQLWELESNPEKLLNDVRVTGAPPAELAPLLAQARANQAQEEDVDHMVELAADLVGAICGFNPFATGPDGDFRVMVQTGGRPARTGWLARLFGR